MRAHKWGIVAATIAVTSSPSPARADHMVHPRTPVQWNDTPCFEFVDRSVDPVYAFDYTIPFEDGVVPGHELPDSRTHQFFATCRQPHRRQFLPNWIAWADVEEAAAAGLVDLDVDEEDVWDTATPWADCGFRITADVDRRPITHEAEAEPVPWDTTDVPVGTYVVWGYTYEPPYNLWSLRAGNIVKVIDGGDPVDIGPGAAITTGQTDIAPGEPLAIEGCVNAMDGSTMSAFYALLENASVDDWTPTWIPFVEDASLQGESFSLDFVPPDDFADEALIRVRVTDPQGRSYDAQMRDVVVFVPPDPPPDNGATTTGEADPDSTTTAPDPDPTTAAAEQDDGDRGCAACRTGARPGPGLALLLFLLGLRRGTRSPRRSTTRNFGRSQ